MQPLPPSEIRRLKSAAQRMKASLKVGRNGLNEAFLKSVREALQLHELVKVRFDEFKADKKILAPQLAELTSSHLVTRVGNVAVLFRRKPAPEHTPSETKSG